MKNYKNKFLLCPSKTKWVYEPSDGFLEKFSKIHGRGLRSVKSPYFYHFKNGGHV